MVRRRAIRRRRREARRRRAPWLGHRIGARRFNRRATLNSFRRWLEDMGDVFMIYVI